MNVKEVYAAHLQTNVKLGCRPATPETKSKILKFAHYHVAELPPAPAGPLGHTLKSSGLSKLFMNDRLGCCVISAYYHLKCMATSLTTTEFVASDQQIVNDYGHIGGYNGTTRSDQGCDIPTALNWWLKNGDQTGTKILGYLAVDATNLPLCRQLIFLFGNLYAGVGLPDDWVGRDMPQSNGFVWGVSGKSDWNNGHCIPFLDYDMDPKNPGLCPNSWGLTGTVTDAAVSAYFTDSAGGELYVIITPDWLDKAKQVAPNAIAWDSLIADFDSIGGNIPAPAPGPNPPTPTPTPTPSTDMEIVWDITAKTVTLPSGVLGIPTSLPTALYIPAINIVVLPSGWTVAGASAHASSAKFDITSIITFITTYGPTFLAAIEALIAAFKTQNLKPQFQEIKPPTA